MNVSAAIAAIGKELNSAAEARELVSFVSGYHNLVLAPDLSREEVAKLRQLVDRRLAGEPLQYLTGRAFFRTVDVRVGSGVFIPRPETEVMVGWAIERLKPGDRVVELCAGSGAISLSLATEISGLEQYAIELSETAFGWAQKNLARTSVELVQGDMADAFPHLDGQVDLLIVNPPYIPLTMFAEVAEDVRQNEPELALFSGLDGLDAIRVVALVAARLLKPGGLLAVEHAEVQRDSVQRVFLDAGCFSQIRGHVDLAGRPRFVTAARI